MVDFITTSWPNAWLTLSPHLGPMHGWLYHHILAQCMVDFITTSWPNAWLTLSPHLGPMYGWLYHHILVQCMVDFITTSWPNVWLTLSQHLGPMYGWLYHNILAQCMVDFITTSWPNVWLTLSPHLGPMYGWLYHNILAQCMVDFITTSWPKYPATTYHTISMLEDSTKSVRNRCMIEVFCDVFVLILCFFFKIFCWYKGFSHRTELDLFPFLSVSENKVSVNCIANKYPTTSLPIFDPMYCYPHGQTTFCTNFDLI